MQHPTTHGVDTTRRRPRRRPTLVVAAVLAALLALEAAPAAAVAAAGPPVPYTSASSTEPSATPGESTPAPEVVEEAEAPGGPDGGVLEGGEAPQQSTAPDPAVEPTEGTATDGGVQQPSGRMFNVIVPPGNKTISEGTATWYAPLFLGVHADITGTFFEPAGARTGAAYLDKRVGSAWVLAAEERPLYVGKFQLIGWNFESFEPSDAGRYRINTYTELSTKQAAFEFDVNVRLRAPHITAQPETVVQAGTGSARFSTSLAPETVPGIITRVQWQVSSDNGYSWRSVGPETIQPTTTSTLDVPLGPSTDRTLYRAEIWRRAMTNPYIIASTPLYTDQVWLNPAVAPVVTRHPSRAISFPEGDRDILTAAATGSPTPTAQWQSSPDGVSSWEDIPGAVGNRYTTPIGTLEPDYPKYVRVVYTNSAGVAASTTTRITVRPRPPVIQGQPADQPATEGDLVSFTATYGGAKAAEVLARWSFSDDGGGTWTEISAADGGHQATYTGPRANLGMHGRLYRVRGTFAGGDGVTSRSALLTVTPASPVASISPMLVEVVEGSPGVFTATVDTSKTPGATVQWSTSSTGMAWTPVAGGTGLSVSVPTTVAGTTYVRATVTNGNASVGVKTVHTERATLRATPRQPVITEEPLDRRVVVGNATSFTVAHSADTPRAAIQWHSSTDGVAWAPITDATAATYDVPTTTLDQSGTRYKAVVTNGEVSTGALSAESRVATLTVVHVPPSSTITLTPRATQVEVLSVP